MHLQWKWTSREGKTTVLCIILAGRSGNQTKLQSLCPSRPIWGSEKGLKSSDFSPTHFQSPRILIFKKKNRRNSWENVFIEKWMMVLCNLWAAVSKTWFMCRSEESVHRTLYLRQRNTSSSVLQLVLIPVVGKKLEFTVFLTRINERNVETTELDSTNF